MIFASPMETLPGIGTVLQFSTRKSGILAGSGFDHAVPLTWPAPDPGGTCLLDPEFEILRDAVQIGTTTRCPDGPV